MPELSNGLDCLRSTRLTALLGRRQGRRPAHRTHPSGEQHRRTHHAASAPCLQSLRDPCSCQSAGLSRSRLDTRAMYPP
jgi:hypothetical protein